MKRRSITATTTAGWRGTAPEERKLIVEAEKVVRVYSEEKIISVPYTLRQLPESAEQLAKDFRYRIQLKIV